MVGLIGALWGEDEGPGVATIVSMFVRPEWRGRGIAARLLNAALERLKQIDGVERVHLEVVVDQSAAVRLYENAGFRPIARNPNRMGDGVVRDELLMELELSRP